MIVTVLDGKTGEYKKDYITSINKLELERSLTAFKKSKVIVSTPTKESIIKAFDLIFVEYQGAFIIGRLYEPTFQNNELVLEFSFGADFHQREEAFASRSATITNYTVDNREFHSVRLSGQHTVVNTDGTLYSDQIIRQVMRKTYCVENYEYSQTTIVPTELSFNFRLDDPRIISNSVEVKFVSDTVNELRLINQQNFNNFTDWYLVNGDVTNILPTDPQFRFVNSVAIVPIAEYNDINKAIELLKKQEYNNSIKFDIDFNFIDLKINELLGLNVELYIPSENIDIDGLNVFKKQGNDIVINTIIGSYKIKNNIMSVEFGLPKSDLTALLGGA